MVRAAGRGTTGLTRNRTGPAQPALLRSLNDEVALRLLLERAPLSRSDMVRLMGVSKPTASQMLARLEEAELVRRVGVTAGRPGRSARLFEINPAAGYAAALDVTPQHIRAQVADLAGDVIGEHELLRPGRAAGSGPGHALDTLDQALAAADLKREDLSCAVVAATGSYDAEADRLRFARHLNGWNGVDLVRRLEAELGVPVFVENDVNLAAIAERRVGAAQDIPDFFLLWAGDGIGGALILEDRLHRGSSGGAGEIAFLQPPGAALVRNPVRGGSGALERWVGGSELLELAHAHGLRGKDSAALVTAAVASKDRQARTFVDVLAMRYALGLSAVIAVVDPRAIVLAGSVLTAGGEPLRVRIAHHLNEVAISNPPLLTSTVEGNPVLVGALCTALDHARDTAFGGA